MTGELSGVPFWRKFLAAIFDAILSFGGFGYLIAGFFGGRTDGGFELNGGPALLLFVLIIAYFILGRMLGGTIGQRIFGTR